MEMMTHAGRDMKDHRIAGLCGAVLAGGQARRMGHVNKALLTVGGVPVIDRILARLGEVCERVIVIANDPAPFAGRDVAVFPDAIPDGGALGGVYTALLRAPAPRVFVCACDMPFISVPLIRHLAFMMEGHEAVVPQDAYGLQPLHALYDRRAAPAVAACLARGELRIGQAIAGMDALILPEADVDPYAAEAEIFFNVNTPGDLAQARTKAAPSGGPPGEP